MKGPWEGENIPVDPGSDFLKGWSLACPRSSRDLIVLGLQFN